MRFLGTLANGLILGAFEQKLMDMEMEEEREEYCEEVKCTSNLGKHKLKEWSLNVVCLLGLSKCRLSMISVFHV